MDWTPAITIAGAITTSTVMLAAIIMIATGQIRSKLNEILNEIKEQGKPHYTKEVEEE